MNHSPQHGNDTPDFDLLLDRLIDGQLAGDAYRDFVGSLDDRPEGWRHCALAFLEEQALRREFGQELAEPDLEPTVATATVGQAPRESRIGWLALAAAVLVAFTLGAVLRGGFRSGPTQETGMPLATAPETENKQDTSSAEPAPAASDERLVATPHDVLDSPPTGPAPAVQLTADYNPALTLVVGEGEQRFRLPVNEVDHLEDDWYDQQQWAFTSQDQQELAAQGFQGTSRQSFVPIDLGDGRQMILPVEEVFIQPVAYQ